MAKDELSTQRYEMDEGIGEVVFVGTKTPLRDLYVALSTNETLEAFCTRTGVQRDAAVAALRLAGGNMPEAAMNAEEWRKDLMSWKDRTSKEISKYEKGAWGFFDKATNILVFLLLLSGIVLTIFLWDRINQRTRTPSKTATSPSYISQPVSSDDFHQRPSLNSLINKSWATRT